ncbi:tetratricopeptide repeat protein [Streptomyces sp. XH2]|uniref:tetratricopeptide repeat protein n=1 Tax=Streptomyces sp. XH2 TaxID=3412483 RepID=UPI003C79DC6B
MVQVTGVTGDVSVTGGESPLYRVDAFPSAPARLTVEEARAQPARLLLARQGVVPFTGRSAELARLAEWRDGAPSVSVLLLHGPGGQGKTRLAARFATLSCEAGWDVLQARHASDPAPVGSAACRRDAAGTGVLMVADYAERWPVTDLLELMQDAARQEGRPARVLLVARPAGAWWQPLANRLDRMGLATDQLPLPTLADDPITSAGDLFAAARERFAAALEAPGAPGIFPPPVVLSKDSGSRSVLAIHMAALAEVDRVRRNPEQAETGLNTPAQFSAYLLNRERDHWQTLHANGRVTTPPDALGRAVYTAALTGAVTYQDSRAALTAIDACPDGDAARLLMDHAVPYPSSTPHAGTVLEPLYPDVLAEDFIALTTPGHGVEDYTPDPWATGAVGRLLTGEGGPPGWTRPAVSTLVAAARRWPHLIEDELAPLFLARQDLVLAAGDIAFVADMMLATLPHTVLLRAAEQIPRPRNTDDARIAALTARLVPKLIANLEDPDGRADMYLYLAERQLSAGRHDDAVIAAEQALAILRPLAADDPAEYEPQLALALTRLGSCLSGAGRHEEAAATQREALAIWERWPQDAYAEYEEEYANALSELSDYLSRAGRSDEALTVSRKALDVWPQAKEDEPVERMHELSIFLSAHALRLARAGEKEEALATAREATGIFRQLAESWPNTFEPAYALLLDNLLRYSLLADRHAEGLNPATEAVAVWRRLAAGDPVHMPELVSALSRLADLLWEAGRREESLRTRYEGLLILNQLTARSSVTYAPALAEALRVFTHRLFEAGRLRAATDFARRTLKLDRHLLAGTRDNAYEFRIVSMLMLLTTMLILQRSELHNALDALNECEALVLRSTAWEPERSAEALQKVGTLKKLVLEAHGRADETEQG